MYPAYHWTPELEALVISAGAAAGFHLVGVAGVVSGDGDLNGVRFSAWVEAGRAGEMEYLKRRDEAGAFLRSGLHVAFPWARSVIFCALNYNSDAPGSLDPAPANRGWIGRYAWSGRATDDAGGATEGPVSPPSDQKSELLPSDYHDQLLGRLRLLETRLRAEIICETRCYVDTGPILERAFAARAGIGWIGKNTCLINQGLGSWLLLGVIVTSIPVQDSHALVSFPAADRCGTCTRCIDACPTDALVAPRELDASRCIAYLTIEKKGSIPEELREGVGRQVFGCDICQDVCPWNRRAPVAVTPGMLPRRELINPPLEGLAAMDNAEFKRRFKGSPLERTGRKRLQRNVAIAMGNSGDREFLPALEAWAAGAEPAIAEAAEWAVRRLRDSSSMLSEESQSDGASTPGEAGAISNNLLEPAPHSASIE
jgi:epoxyqueuosine reductase